MPYLYKVKRAFLAVLCLLIQWNSIGQSGNPFDIIRSEVPVEVAEPIKGEEQKAAPPTKLQGDNPFSVSHIPIRKNQYEEIKKLAPANQVAEENISLLSLPLWLIMLSLIGMAFLIYQRKDHLTMLVRSLTNENFMRMTNMAENSGFSLHYILGYLIYLLNVALFMYLLITRYFSKTSELLSQPIEGGWRFFIQLLGILALFFVGKHVMNNLFGWIFNVVKEARLYDFAIISIYNLMGVFFLFLNILIVFGPIVWIRALAIMGATTFIIFLLSRHYRGLRIARQHVNNYFLHFFVYFCAFEISPWVMVYALTKDFI